MSLEALRSLVETSNPDDWVRMDHPPILPMFHPTNTHDHGLGLEAAYHHTLLTHVDDVEVQLAYGMDADYTPTGQSNHHPRTYEWAEKFLHPEGTLVRVHTLYRGSVVDHVYVISFDGAWLPSPELIDDGSGDLQKVFTGRSLRIARLLHSIDYQVDADEGERLMRQSGLRVVD